MKNKILVGVIIASNVLYLAAEIYTWGPIGVVVLILKGLLTVGGVSLFCIFRTLDKAREVSDAMQTASRNITLWDERAILRLRAIYDDGPVYKLPEIDALETKGQIDYLLEERQRHIQEEALAAYEIAAALIALAAWVKGTKPYEITNDIQLRDLPTLLQHRSFGLKWLYRELTIEGKPLEIKSDGTDLIRGITGLFDRHAEVLQELGHLACIQARPKAREIRVDLVYQGQEADLSARIQSVAQRS